MTSITVDDPNQVANVIETALPGTSVYLPNTSFELSATIHIPSGVTVIGRPETAITFSSGDGVYAFDLSSSNDASLKKLEIDISNGKGGVYADGSENISIDGVTISGNMYESESIAYAPNVAVYVTNSHDVSVTNSAVFNGFGGIYSINNNNVVISNNVLDHTNFGQIVVSGDTIDIRDNHVSFSGTPSENDAVSRQGDSFTSLGSTNLNIVGNVFDNPLCYQISFWDGVNSHIYIADNYIGNGITSAIYFDTEVSDVTIENNLFKNNSEQGVVFQHYSSDVSINDNVFSGDGVMINGIVDNMLLSGNNLSEIVNDFTLPGLVDSQNIINTVDSNLPNIYYDDTVSADTGPRVTQSHPSWADLPSNLEVAAGSSLNAVDILGIDLDGVDALQFYDGRPGENGLRMSLGGDMSSADQLLVYAGDASNVTIVSGDTSDHQWFYVRALVQGEWSSWYSIDVTTLADQSANDVYAVRFPNDRTYETGPTAGGIDEVISSSIMYRLEGGVENLHLVDGALNGFGNDLDNVITGNAASNVLAGFAGDDSISGGDGNDTLYGNEGADDLRGGGGEDVLLGGDGADILDGGPGADYLAGGQGDDVYVIDADDMVVEAPGEGTDTVRSGLASYVLGMQLENLVLLEAAHDGYGNNFANVITGNDADNIISAGGGDDTVYGMAGDDKIWGDAGDDHLFGNDGNDLLYGGPGADTLVGGAGDDIYVVEDDLDTIIESPSEGTDTVYSYVPSYRLGAQLENLVLLGEAHDGYGNNFANVIVGNDLDNILSGGGGNDQMYGGAGDDGMWGDDGDDNLFGGAGADILFGGNGNDVLSGEQGADTLIGGAGADTFVLSDDAPDLILDFEVSIDKIKLSVGPVPGGLQDYKNPVPGHTEAALLYDSQSGNLYYDPDGVGSAAPVHLATLYGAPKLTISDFIFA